MMEKWPASLVEKIKQGRKLSNEDKLNISIQENLDKVQEQRLRHKQGENTMSTKTSKKSTKKVDKKKSTEKVTKKVAKKVEKKGSNKKFVSASGKYKNVRHLMETLFKKNASTLYDDTEKTVKKEFPMSKFAKGDHAWYKNKIVSHNEWRHVEPPKKVPTAKIKK